MISSLRRFPHQPCEIPGARGALIVRMRTSTVAIPPKCIILRFANDTTHSLYTANDTRAELY